MRLRSVLAFTGFGLLMFAGKAYWSHWDSLHVAASYDMQSRLLLETYTVTVWQLIAGAFACWVVALYQPLWTWLERRDRD